ncbi:MAG: M3 family metallopeptidase, partial [Bacteroidales bacterium]
MTNPLMSEWQTPYGVAPFSFIKAEHFKPAVEAAIRNASEEIDSITINPQPPTFENTVEALEHSGERLGQISMILFNLNSADTSKELQAVASEVSPLLTRFSNDITLNIKLFDRIKSIYDSRASLNLTTEQLMLLEKKYRNFILGGAGLKEEERSRFREISEELSRLALKFEENVLEDTNAFELHITNRDDLAGLPPDLIEAASNEAAGRSKDGWVFTLHFPSYVPFMQYSDRRELREKMLKAYSSRSYHGDIMDNRQLVLGIVNLRLELARSLGFGNYADMILGDRMAENTQTVTSFLEQLYAACRPAARLDFNDVREFAGLSGHFGNIERWDWSYFSEKLKKSKYNIDDEILKPYFSLENVRQAIFGLAGRLFGLKFSPGPDIPVYNEEVRAWEVRNAENDLQAVLFLDFHPRKGKNGGAWMTSFRDQRMANGNRVIPLISMVMNFTRPTTTRPSLLSFNEVTTFLHEFGHALHGMLSECTYESIAGTNVARDFVELPSQFMQNWIFEHEWLDSWAVHYQTGEKIPYEIIDRIREASTFNEGYACNRQVGFGLLDMAWHTITGKCEEDVNEFEQRIMERTELFTKVESTNMSCSFTHLFGGGYAAG